MKQGSPTVKRAYIRNTGCIRRVSKMTDKVPPKVIERRAEEMSKYCGVES